MSDLINQVDAIFSEWDKTDSPGCAIGIIQNGETVYKRGYGIANLESNVPITTSSVFYLASVSKQFTAMAVALLVEMGKVALTDDVRTYIPELPNYNAEITVEHLIHHTSGIHDYLWLGSLTGKRLEDVWTEKELFDMLSRQNELNFNPGDQYVYSNSGYVLLSIIVKRVTGVSMQEFSHEHIFRPLGMENTTFKEDHQLLILNRVHGYSRSSDDNFRNEYHNLQVVGDGGLYSSVDDLIQWDQNFYNNKLGNGKQSLIALVHTTAALNDGTKQKYAFGLGYGTYCGLNYVTHGGGLNGARTQIKRFPEQKFTVICLSNLSDFDTDDVISKIVDIYLVDFLQSAETGKVPDECELNQEKLSIYTGLYRNPITGVTLWVELQDDQPVVRFSSGFTANLSALGNKHFKVVGLPMDVKFKPFKNGNKYQMIVFGNNPPPVVYKPDIPTNPTPSALNKYCGKYHSDELNTDYSCQVNEGNLILSHSKAEDIVLLPTNLDGFSGNGFDVHFWRDENELIYGFSLHHPQIWNIKFRRINKTS